MTNVSLEHVKAYAKIVQTALGQQTVWYHPEKDEIKLAPCGNLSYLMMYFDGYNFIGHLL